MSDYTIERITQITPEVLDATRLLAPQLQSPSQVTLTEEYLQEIVDSNNEYWLMARRSSDARFIGSVILVVPTYWTNRRTMIENLVVDKDAREKGAGTALIREAITIADNRGVNSVRIATRKDNAPVKHILAKIGFPIDTAQDHFEMWLHDGPRF